MFPLLTTTRPPLWKHWVPGTLACLLLADAIHAEPAAMAARFDDGVLQRLGIAPDTARYLSDAARFSPGWHRVELNVNGVARGPIAIEIDPEGALVFHRDLLDHAGLKAPDTSSAGPYDFLTVYPQTQVQLHPNKDAVALVTPQDALKPAGNGAANFEKGGTAGLLNYSLFGSQNRFGDNHTRYLASNTEVGVNMNNWIARSRQAFVSINGNDTFQSLYTYVQKNLGQGDQTLQVGQINAGNPVFPGAPITGIQLIPESALQSRAGGVTIDGIATSQARVEVRQSGALIYTTIVAPGAFSLRDIVPVSGLTRFDVEVFEDDGHVQQFSVHNALNLAPSQKPLAYSVAAGRVYNQGQAGSAKPVLVSGAVEWAPDRDHLLSGGLMLSDNRYKAAGLALDKSLAPQTQLNLRNVLAHSEKNRTRGVQTNLSLSTHLGDSFSLGAYSTLQSAAFRSFDDTLATDRSAQPDTQRLLQYGVSVGWTNPGLGNFTAGTSTSSDPNSKNALFSAGWNKAFKHATASLNVQQMVSAQPRETPGRQLSRRTTAYLRVDIPFGKQHRTSSYVNRSDNHTRYGSSLEGRYDEQLSYRLNAEHTHPGQARSLAASVNTLSSSNQARLGYSQSNNGNVSWNGQMQGGFAVHDEGITASPYHLQDTFAVATVAGVPNVKLTTPGGPVWTNHSGKAVIATVPPYRAARVNIHTPSLPRNTDVTNASKTLSASRGAVLKLQYPVITSRRVLLSVTYSDATRPPKGAAVFDAEGRFVTTVIDDGKIYLNDAQPDSTLRIEDPYGAACLVTPRLPELHSQDAYFETLEAVCEATLA